MTVGEILEYLSRLAPLETADSYDNVGLLVGGADAEVTGVCCCVDITHGVIQEASEKGANLIISHHPVIFDGLKNIQTWNPVTELVKNEKCGGGQSPGCTTMREKSTVRASMRGGVPVLKRLSEKPSSVSEADKPDAPSSPDGPD